MVTFDVITIGSATMDVFVRTEHEKIIRQQQGTRARKKFLAYPVGQKIRIEQLEFSLGGGGTNTAVSFSRLGLKTGFLGQVGTDEHARTIIADLHREKVTFLGSEKGISGYSVVLDAQGKDRTILTYRGANDTWSSRKPLPPSTWLYAATMMGTSFSSLVKTVLQAKNRGTKIAFNPNLYLAEQGIPRLKNILSRCDVLIVNLDEARALTKTHHQASDLLTLLRRTGPRCVVITDGENGAWADDGLSPIHIAARPVNVVETTGAGDAFGSAFVAGQIDGLSLEKSLQLAMINAESVIAHYGAKNILLTKKEAYKHLLRDTHKIRKIR